MFLSCASERFIEIENDEDYCRNCNRLMDYNDKYYIPCYRYAYHIDIPDCSK